MESMDLRPRDNVSELQLILADWDFWAILKSILITLPGCSFCNPSGGCYERRERF